MMWPIRCCPGSRGTARRSATPVPAAFVRAALVGATLAGCSGSGAGLDENGRPLESGPPAVDDFTRIQNEIFTPVCTACHAGASAPVGLRLDAGNSHALLVNVPSAEVSSLLRVKPGDAEASYLVQKIEGRAAAGGRMPLGGPPLPQASIDLVKQWIAAGAAPAASGADPNAPLQIVATIPAQDEAVPKTSETVLIFNHELDASLASSERVSLMASGGDGSFAEGNEVLLQPDAVTLSQANPALLRLHFAKPLPADRYEMRVHDAGGIALADTAGAVLDGDGDGRAGGGYRTTFDVIEGPSQSGAGQ